MPKKRSKPKAAFKPVPAVEKPVAKDRSRFGAIFETVRGTYGEHAVFFGSDLPVLNRIPSGVLSLDLELGGGWPRSRIIHIWGPKSTGKSLIAYLAAAQGSRHCNWCSMHLDRCVCKAKDPIATAWVDVEHSDDPLWRKKLGVDPKLFIRLEPEHAAQAVDMADYAMRQPDIGLVVVDSIGGMVFKDNLESSAEENVQPGSLARLMSRGTAKFIQALSRRYEHPKSKQAVINPCTVILINQIRHSIGRVPLPPAPPAGEAIRHQSAIELKLWFANSDIDYEVLSSGVQHGVRQTINFLTDKNKTFLPKRGGQFTLDFRSGQVDNDAIVGQYAVNYGLIIERKGGNYIIGDPKDKSAIKFKCKADALGAVLRKRGLIEVMRTEITAAHKLDIQGVLIAEPDTVEEVSDADEETLELT